MIVEKDSIRYRVHRYVQNGANGEVDRRNGLENARTSVGAREGRQDEIQLRLATVAFDQRRSTSSVTSPRQRGLGSGSSDDFCRRDCLASLSVEERVEDTVLRGWIDVRDVFPYLLLPSPLARPLVPPRTRHRPAVGVSEHQSPIAEPLLLRRGIPAALTSRPSLRPLPLLSSAHFPRPGLFTPRKTPSMSVAACKQ